MSLLGGGGGGIGCDILVGGDVVDIDVDRRHFGRLGAKRGIEQNIRYIRFGSHDEPSV